MPIPVDVAFATDARLGEGPVWDHARGALLWVDIERGEIHALDASGGDELVARFAESVGSVVPRRDGGLVAAVGTEVVFMSSAGVTESRRRVTRRRGVRLNDGACDQTGRFWIGSMAPDGRPGMGALFVVSTDRKVRRVFKRLGIANGVDWTDDGARMYFIDSREQRVDVCTVVDGLPVDRRAFVEIPSDVGTPDGMTVDAEGGVWVALFGGSALHRYSPGGVLDEVVPIPTTFVTSCAFGGDEATDLYVTSARGPLSERARRDEPLAGSVFVVHPGVAGRPANTFAG